MTPHYEIKKLTDALKAKKLSKSEMEAMAQCFLKLAVAGTGERFSIETLIKKANPNGTEIKPLLMHPEAMTWAILAHIIIGCQQFLADTGQTIGIEALMQLCQKGKNGSSALKIDSPDEKPKITWKPFSI
ncbi:MAG: hypothetical protein Q8M43_06505 [Sulfuricurvum sp.]|uniref:hypothetical protein n=1 Tax=Sulfuricurvum sp. TaxID=2025608 RepID=UPI002733A6AF|nr:hypothetical protein [Sulfuricurvum sp.]MDP3291665.1 hypothetical protein [Sulfuricurvum sp.]